MVGVQFVGMRQSPLLPLLAFFAICVSAHGAPRVLTGCEDNQIVTGLSPITAAADKLHSRPGATKTIYLDFTGLNPVVNSPWNAGATFTMPKYSGTAKNIQNIWMRVADAFAPFDVDVTTELPVGGITAHKANFQRCIIGGNPFMVTDPLVAPGTVESQGDWTGGTSYLGSAINPALIAAAYDEVPCFVFSAPPFTLTEMETAGAISHQLGHTMGLKHKGVATNITAIWKTGNCSIDGRFYFGHGTENAVDSWGPIMGLPVYGQNRQSWVGAWYALPTTITTPLGTTLVDNSSETTLELTALTAALGRSSTTSSAPLGLFIPGNSVGYASSLTIAGGTIHIGGSFHSYSFMTNPGLVTMKVVTVQPVGALGPVDTKVVSNLKVGLLLTDEHGRVVSSTTETTGTYPEQGATLSFTSKKSAIYTLVISSVGAAGTIATSGNLGVSWDAYGSVGRYSLWGTWPAPSYISPTSAITASPTTVVFGSTVNFSGTASDANIGNDNNAFTYSWDFGDTRSASNTTKVSNVATSNVSHQYKAPGTYTARLFVTDSFGATSLAATKVITVTGSSAPRVLIESPVAASWVTVTKVERAANVSCRVVDQYGLPIVGALVSVNCVTSPGSALTKIGVKTDAAGVFTYTMPKQLTTTATKPGSLTFTITGVTNIKAGTPYTPTVGTAGVTLSNAGVATPF